MATAYATPADLEAFVSASIWAKISEPERLLTRASELLDGTVRTPFALDDMTGLPSDSDTAAAMRDAACAQVEQWVEVSEENDIDGLAATTVSVTGYSGFRAPKLAPRAFRILHVAGLLSAGVAELPTSTRFFLTEQGA